MFSDLQKKLSDLFSSSETQKKYPNQQEIITKMGVYEHDQPYNPSKTTTLMGIREHGQPHFTTITNMCVREHGNPYMNQNMPSYSNQSSFSSYSGFSEFIPDNRPDMSFMCIREHGRPFER